MLGELFGYLLCSALALALDTGTMMLALRCGASVALAAALGFLTGVTSAYVSSVLLVFKNHRIQDRSTEFALFVAIGTAGLALTELLLWLFTQRCGLAPLPSKLATAAIVFVFNFGVRKVVLFSTAQPRHAADRRLQTLA